MVDYRVLVFIIGSIWCAACGQGKQNDDGSYVLSVTVEAYEEKNQNNVVQRFETDTIFAPSAVAAYSKGIQKYASVLMHVEQFPDSIKGATGLNIYNSRGEEIAGTIPQPQRDSIIMDFIQFARRSSIPYYDRVKDFELKLMKAR